VSIHPRRSQFANRPNSVSRNRDFWTLKKPAADSVILTLKRKHQEYGGIRPRSRGCARVVVALSAGVPQHVIEPGELKVIEILVEYLLPMPNIYLGNVYL
jgi:hypothetical protein